jgi:hypothetical protein
MEARKELYVYITNYFKSRLFQTLISPKVTFILSGGCTRDQNGEIQNLDFPISVTKTTVSVMLEHSFPTLSEGDLDVWRFVDVFSDKNVHVYSFDGDVFLIGLLHVKHYLTKNKTRVINVVTVRSVDSKTPTEASVAATMRNKEMCANIYSRVLEETGNIERAFVASGGVTPSAFEAAQKRAPRRQPIKMLYYIDVIGIYSDIIQEALDVVREARHVHKCSDFQLFDPVESFVVAFFLSSDSHDYVQTKLISNGVGSSNIWNTYRTHLHLIGDLVRVYYEPADDGQFKRYFVIDVEAMVRFSKYLYVEKYKKNPETHFNKNVKIEDVHKVAAQCAWTLHYWYDGIFPNIPIADGLITDPTNDLSIYGYKYKEWADIVVLSDFRIAPPITITTSSSSKRTQREENEIPKEDSKKQRIMKSTAPVAIEKKQIHSSGDDDLLSYSIVDVWVSGSVSLQGSGIYFAEDSDNNHFIPNNEENNDDNNALAIKAVDLAINTLYELYGDSCPCTIITDSVFIINLFKNLDEGKNEENGKETYLKFKKFSDLTIRTAHKISDLEKINKIK